MKKYLQTVLVCLCLISAGVVTTMSVCAEKEIERTTHSEPAGATMTVSERQGGEMEWQSPRTELEE